MNEEQLLSLISATPAVKDAGFFLPNAKKIVPMNAVTVNQYVTRIVPRFEAVKSLYARIADIAKRVKDTEEQKEQIAAIEQEALADRIKLGIDEGVLEQAALIAIGLGAPGNRRVEDAVLAWHDEDFLAYSEELARRSWGGNPADFFGRVSNRVLSGMLGAMGMGVTATSSGKKPSLRRQKIKS